MSRPVLALLIPLLLAAALGCAPSYRTDTEAVTTDSEAGLIDDESEGDYSKDAAEEAIIDAAIGGAAGDLISDFMDRQAQELSDSLEDAKVERIEEGIKITIQSRVLFDINRSDLLPSANAYLAQLAGILDQYGETNILIEAHTDSTGTEEHNMDLTNERVNSIGNFLADQNVDPTRMKLVGYGETEPAYANDSVKGRELNRRVEIAIFANERLREAAEEEAGY